MRVRSQRFLSSSSLGPSLLSFGADAPNDPPVVHGARNSCAIDVIERRFAVLVSDRAAAIASCCQSLSLGKGVREGGFGDTIDRCGHLESSEIVTLGVEICLWDDRGKEENCCLVRVNIREYTFIRMIFRVSIGFRNFVNSNRS